MATMTVFSTASICYLKAIGAVREFRSKTKKQMGVTDVLGTKQQHQYLQLGINSQELFCSIDILLASETLPVTQSPYIYDSKTGLLEQRVEPTATQVGLNPCCCT